MVAEWLRYSRICIVTESLLPLQSRGKSHLDLANGWVWMITTNMSESLSVTRQKLRLTLNIIWLAIPVKLNVIMFHDIVNKKLLEPIKSINQSLLDLVKELQALEQI